MENGDIGFKSNFQVSDWSDSVDNCTNKQQEEAHFERNRSVRWVEFEVAVAHPGGGV